MPKIVSLLNFERVYGIMRVDLHFGDPPWIDRPRIAAPRRVPDLTDSDSAVVRQSRVSRFT